VKSNGLEFLSARVDQACCTDFAAFIKPGVKLILVNLLKPIRLCFVVITLTRTPPFAGAYLACPVSLFVVPCLTWETVIFVIVTS